MLKVERFVNQLMTSNCYVVYDEDTRRCVVIDPASEKSLREIAFIVERNLTLDYIVLTHEHSDHTWGVNALKDHYPDAKILCSEACNKYAPKASRAYFLLYYDDPNYRYVIYPADILIDGNELPLEWAGHKMSFAMTPGHSYGSMCIGIEDMLFTGDTIMPFPPYFNGRDSNEDDWKQSVKRIMSLYDEETIVYPGHGESLTLGEWCNKKVTVR